MCENKTRGEQISQQNRQPLEKKKDLATDCKSISAQWYKLRRVSRGIFKKNYRPRTPYMGVLILQNDQGLFLSQELTRANCRAESAEILHDSLLGYSTWVSRGFF